MQNEATFITDMDTGNSVFLLTGAAKSLDFGPLPKIRASHVIPADPLLRVIFNFIRSHCTDTGPLAAFTRRWPCAWQIDTTPVGGPILPGVWYNRAEAIDAEVEFLNDWFVWGKDEKKKKVSTTVHAGGPAFAMTPPKHKKHVKAPDTRAFEKDFYEKVAT